MGQAPKYDFAFVTDNTTFDQLDHTEWYRSSFEDVFQDQGQWDWDPTAKIGDLCLEIIRTANPSRVRLSGLIYLDNEENESVTLEGRGELDEDGSLARGRLFVTAGTGKFIGRHDVIRLNVRNPKRWGADDAP